jgi:response regulator NasT
MTAQFREGQQNVRQASVLIVGSDPLIRQDLKTQVTALGHRVVGEAENGSQTLSLTRNLHPDVVLLDLLLSATSGLEVAQALFVERLAAVVLFTGAEYSESLEKLEETGVTGFLTMPFRPSDLRAVLPIAVARFQERLALEVEVKNLNDRMEARKLVGRAKAILMERHGLSERDAFKRIQSQSIALGKQAHEIAQAIITASEITLVGSGVASGAVAEGTESRPSVARPPRGEKSSLDAIQP